jgi:putative acetyltransferase
MRIRVEEPADRGHVFAVEAAAFARPLEAELVETLRASAWPRLSLVAELDGEIVGHVFFSPVSIEGAPAAPACAGLGPLAVLPARQRLGVGAALVQEGLCRCSALGWKAVFLLGNPAYYARFGFTLAAERGLHYEELDAAFQVIELEAGALHGCRGQVRYHEAFSATIPG